MSRSVLFWITFNVIVFLMLWFDLSMTQKRHRTITLREAGLWSLAWVVVSLLFGAGIWVFDSPQRSLEFFTAYLLEKSLSVDNMFVFIMVFSYFAVDPLHQPRVLKWGILGALVLRFLLIVAGTTLIAAFHWSLYIFGVLLVYTGWHMAFSQSESFDPDHNRFFKWLRKKIPIEGFHGNSFFVIKGGRRWATPLFLALIFVEISDVVFALDSLPAVFGVTTDFFVVYTSNVFAILGLRALFFLLSGLVQKFSLLKYGVAVILGFVGVKMLVVDIFHVSTLASLSIILGVLTISVVWSMILQPREVPRTPQT